MRIKELLEKLKMAERKADEASDAWGEEPENNDLETLFNEAYKRQNEVFKETAREIASVIKVDVMTAEIMLRKKRPEIEELVNALREEK